MGNNVRHTERTIPVLLGGDDEHVLAKADIFQTPDSVLIQVTASGPESKLLAEFLGQQEIIAVGFQAIPVQNIRERKSISDAKD